MKLRHHQQLAVDFARDRQASLIASGMGTGKTAIALALMEEWQAKRTLVLCPTSVRGVWRREIAKHLDNPPAAVILDWGTIRERADYIAACWNNWNGRMVVALNYEAAWRPPMNNLLASLDWDLVILDESHRVQGTSRIAQWCDQLSVKAKRRLCLSGTPLTQDPMSVWAQSRFLDWTVFPQSLDRFKKRYHRFYAVAVRKSIEKMNEYRLTVGRPLFVPPARLVAGTIRTEEYLERLRRIAFRVESAVLDLPSITHSRIPVKLSERARGLHEEVCHDHRYEIESGLWPHLSESYRTTMRAQQITSGFLPDQDGRPVCIDTGKAEALYDLLRDSRPEPVVVFCRFVADMDTVEAVACKLGLPYAEVSGRRKDGITPTAEMNPDAAVVAVQEQAGGAGIDLTRARIAVFYSLSWSVAQHQQAIARLHRPPAPKDRPVVVYSLVAEDSIDEEMLRALESRRAMVQQVWDEVRDP